MATSKAGDEGMSTPDYSLGEAVLEAGADIESLVFQTLMEATKSAQDDLKQIMSDVKAINRTKASLRDLLCAMRRDVATATKSEMEGRGVEFSPHGLGGEGAYHEVPLPILDHGCADAATTAVVDLVDGEVVSVHQLEAAADSVKNRLDSLSELSELESLRLQMAMDRFNKLMTTLSNLLKKFSDTSQAITQNLK